MYLFHFFFLFIFLRFDIYQIIFSPIFHKRNRGIVLVDAKVLRKVSVAKKRTVTCCSSFLHQSIIDFL